MHAGKTRQDSMLQESMDFLDTCSAILLTTNTASKELLSFHHYQDILDKTMNRLRTNLKTSII
jgi:hypothetical protein